MKNVYMQLEKFLEDSLNEKARPREHAILAIRLMDRPIRPMFPEGFRNEVQVVSDCNVI